MHVYSAKDLKELFDLPPPLLRSLVREGHVNPIQSSGGTAYQFQDLLLLRTAAALRAAKIAPRKIIQALDKIRQSLPAGAPLNVLTVAPQGSSIAVRQGAHLWEAQSGQYALPLAHRDVRGLVAPLPAAPDAAAPDTAQRSFDAACALEECNAGAARAAYEVCLRADPMHLEARINLGRLLHLAGELEAAENIYQAANGGSALLLFNLAVLLEDRQRDAEAVAKYRACIAIDPQFADAHFNLARLHERAQQPREALRHLLAYKRLCRGDA